MKIYYAHWMVGNARFGWRYHNDGVWYSNDWYRKLHVKNGVYYDYVKFSSMKITRR